MVFDNTLAELATLIKRLEVSDAGGDVGGSVGRSYGGAAPTPHAGTAQAGAGGVGRSYGGAPPTPMTRTDESEQCPYNHDQESFERGEDVPRDIARHSSMPQLGGTVTMTTEEGYELVSALPDDGAAEEAVSQEYKDLSFETNKLLVVLDMDHTIVGDLEALSDRDNVETNLPWEHWPSGKPRGLSVEDIVPYLGRGMIRPGFVDFITLVRKFGATVVIYTHSEDKWARKVVKAIESFVGFDFVHRVFTRMDCKDGHPGFQARKSLKFVVREMAREFATIDHVLFLDDDATAVPEDEKSRLVVIPNFDHWESCRWDENLTPECLERNPPLLVQKLLSAVREWGIASPVHGKKVLSELDTRAHDRWKAQIETKHNMRENFNKVLAKDQVFHKLQAALSDAIKRGTASGEFDHKSLPSLLSQALQASEPQMNSLARATSH